MLAHERARARQVDLLAVGHEQDERMLERRAGQQRARALDQRRDARAVVGRARSGRDGIVVRGQRDRRPARAPGDPGDDVAHARHDAVATPRPARPGPAARARSRAARRGAARARARAPRCRPGAARRRASRRSSTARARARENCAGRRVGRARIGQHARIRGREPGQEEHEPTRARRCRRGPGRSSSASPCAAAG